MPKKSTFHTEAEQNEILDKPVNPTGAGEDPALQAMLSDKFVKAGDLEAAAIAAAVAKLIRGDIMGDMGKMLERLDNMEKAQQKYEADRQAWVQEQFKQAERTKKEHGTDIDKAEAGKFLQKVMQDVRAESAAHKLELDRKARDAKKVSVVSEGKPTRIRMGENLVTKYEPEIIRYEHLSFILQPGVPTDVPAFIYEAWTKEREILRRKDSALKARLMNNESFDRIIEVAPEVNPQYSRNVQAQVDSKNLPQGGDHA